MPRLTKIYTRTGDDGTTGLGGGQRVLKNAPRIEAYGTVDELNSALGVACACSLDQKLLTWFGSIQNDLFHLGSDLCILEEDKLKFQVPRIEARHVDKLENYIDSLEADLGPLQNFILPGGSAGAAQLHLARCICRRAEREVFSLSRQEAIGAFVLPYLNRLSDLLFQSARYENKSKNVGDILWDSHA